MFAANTELQITETDFDLLKNSFKDFIQNKTEFKDYNFEGSTLNYILDILAYNSYQQSIYTNMAVNENFLDTAQLRSNVVSQAKKLGYVPYSRNPSLMTIDITFTPSDSPSAIVIPRLSKFSGKKNNITYNYVTLQNNVITDGNSTRISISQGTWTDQQFVYDSETKFYELINSNISIDTVTVKVKDSITSTTYVEYDRALDITEIKSTSNVFFIEESVNGNYEIFFGDGILGRSLQTGNYIEVGYLVTDGVEANDINNIKAVGYSGYNSIDENSKYEASSLVVIDKSAGGSEREEINSIKFNAPRYYTTQNRLVTVPDFKNFITSNYTFIDSLAVWGGESNVPPIAGRVIISLKPKNGYVLSDSRKNQMILEMKKRNVLAIEPIIIDPTFTYVKPEIRVNYTSQNSSLTSQEIFSKVNAAILNYEKNSLGVFENAFIFSKLSSIIDNADASIESNEMTIELEKRFTPLIGSKTTYILRFFSELYHPYDGFLGSVSSSGFKINTSSETLYLDDDGNGKLRLYYLENQINKVYINNEIGTVNYETGEMKIEEIHFTETSFGSEIRVFIKPKSNNYFPDNNQIILLSYPRISMYDRSIEEFTRIESITALGNVSPVSANETNVPITL